MVEKVKQSSCHLFGELKVPNLGGGLTASFAQVDLDAQQVVQTEVGLRCLTMVLVLGKTS